MPDDLILECGATELSIKKQICASSKDNAERIVRKLFNAEAERRCRESVCPNDGKTCEPHHIIGLTVTCKPVQGKCPGSPDHPLHRFECTAKGTVDCICK